MHVWCLAAINWLLFLSEKAYDITILSWCKALHSTVDHDIVFPTLRNVHWVSIVVNISVDRNFKMDHLCSSRWCCKYAKIKWTPFLKTVMSIGFIKYRKTLKKLIGDDLISNINGENCCHPQITMNIHIKIHLKRTNMAKAFAWDVPRMISYWTVATCVCNYHM